MSELTQLIRTQLEETYPQIAVRGEISNFKHHRSGHMYFTIKDDRAELRSVMFRGTNRFLNFQPEDGMQVIATGRISVYEARGQYQLIASMLEPSGLGALYQAFEALKRRLEAEGLFASEHKESLPEIPTMAGVITSGSGAAVRDIIQVLGRRAPYVNVTVRPTRVQGEGAADDIVQALDEFEQWGKAEVLIVGRGGGSLEDLWAFNEEPVIRALYDCSFPVISAVGHESDITLSDLVADVRAPTPSAAAELVAPDIQELMETLKQVGQSMRRMLTHRLEQAWQQVDHLGQRYAFQQPLRQIERFGERLHDSHLDLNRAITNLMSLTKSELNGMEEKLFALSPQSVLDRGYSIAFRDRDDVIVRTPEDLEPGEGFRLHTSGGSLAAQRRRNGNSRSQPS